MWLLLILASTQKLLVLKIPLFIALLKILKVLNFLQAISLLNGITFRAIGFTEPLSVKAECAKPDFPTRIDWDQFFASNKNLDEKEPGERPDTVYISGLPFDWFKVILELPVLSYSF